MALAHELRELRCRVAPIIITPGPSLSKEAGNEKEKEEEEEGGEMFSLQKMAVAQSTIPLFVLCVNGACRERGGGWTCLPIISYVGTLGSACF